MDKETEAEREQINAYVNRARDDAALWLIQKIVGHLRARDIDIPHFEELCLQCTSGHAHEPAMEIAMAQHVYGFARSFEIEKRERQKLLADMRSRQHPR